MYEFLIKELCNSKEECLCKMVPKVCAYVCVQKGEHVVHGKLLILTHQSFSFPLSEWWSSVC